MFVRNLDDVYLAYEQDTAFEELRRAAKQIVKGAGNPSPDVMFIGEAPGLEEDAIGVPFVGAAGQMLNELLRGAGFSRAVPEAQYSCFISNIVKYRPPGNRDPRKSEIKSSIPYMRLEIHFLRPRIVVTLGRYATSALWPEAPSISECHGWVRDLESAGSSYRHMPMYHPAFGIYDRRNRDQLIRDFALLKQELADV